jgi:hypothetical protein
VWKTQIFGDMKKTKKEKKTRYIKIPESTYKTWKLDRERLLKLKAYHQLMGHILDRIKYNGTHSG